MAKFVILALLATVTSLAESSTGGTLKITWEDCGDASTHGKVTDLEPTSIEIGSVATITGTGTVDEAISGGTFELDMKASIISKTWTGNICEPKTFTIPLGLGTVTWDGMKCPISPGTTSVPMDVKMSSSIPASLATASISAKATATSGDKLLCMNVHLAKASSPASEEAIAAPAITQELVDEINSKQTSWVAHMSPRFQGATLGDIKQLCGTILKGDPRYNNKLEEKTSDNAWVPEDQIPSEFDVRTQWPKCASVSGDIRDQSSCGSCWAFGSTEAFNDRRCIATGDTTLLSPEDTTANCGLFKCMSMGCNGGQPANAWNWFKSTGVVTGGDYEDIGKGDTCAPYSLAPCAHHVPPTAKYPACPSKEYPTPSIGSKCTESKYAKSYSADKKMASDAYNLGSVLKIQQDMVQYGSATAAFTVYADFPTYKSGVYHHTTGSALGGHAIRLLGWGTESGQDYWLVANSWNDAWGDHGTFKIKRGTNECGIEGQVSAGTASSSDVRNSIVV